MNRKNQFYALLRTLSICAVGVLFSAEGNLPNIRQPPIRRISSSKKVIYGLSVKVNHTTVGIRSGCAEFFDLLRDLDQDLMSLVIPNLFWAFLPYPSCTINTTIIAQHEVEYTPRLDDSSLSHRSNNRRNEALRYRFPSSACILLFYLTLFVVQVNLRYNRAVDVSYCSFVASFVVHPIISLPWSPSDRSTLPDFPTSLLPCPHSFHLQQAALSYPWQHPTRFILAIFSTPSGFEHSCSPNSHSALDSSLLFDPSLPYLLSTSIKESPTLSFNSLTAESLTAGFHLCFGNALTL